MPLSKAKLVELVIAQLEAELVHARGAARSASEAATAEENRPENQYDTRALEASFLARGQAMRVSDLEQAIKVLRDLPLKPIPQDAPVQTGALITTDCDGVEQLHFLLPAGAGLQVDLSGKKITIVTTSSPLGAGFLGKAAGDTFTFRRGAVAKEYEIVSVE